MLNRSTERILLILLLIMLSVDAMAQPRFFQRSGRGFALTSGWIDHKYTGAIDVAESFEYQGIGIGLSYVGTQLRAWVLYARPNGNGSFFDFSAKGWILPSTLTKERQATTISAPVGFLVAARRVSVENNPAPLNAQAILLGIGGDVQHALTPRTKIQVQVMPLAGITGSREADAVGFSWATDAEVLLTVQNAFSTLGFFIGYTFRYQTWNVNGSRAFTEIVDELYDYTGMVHALSTGIQL